MPGILHTAPALVVRLLLSATAMIYLTALALAPAKLGGVIREGRRGSVQLVWLWASLGSCLYLGVRDMLEPLGEPLRSGGAFIFGFFGALVILYRLQRASAPTHPPPGR